ncbi:MAG: alkaline phosphatase D family protein, partial [Thermomicrobiales bacterium]|nr:alkaline phosphatase D family protein [Thermomicrobiales bacterium]
MQTVSRFPHGELANAAELGAVTDRGVRVWVRQPDTDAVALRLEVDGRRPVTTTLPLSAAHDWTGATELALPEPAPNTPFAVHAGGSTLRGRFAPAPNEHAAFTFAFGSCHYPFAVDETGAVRLRGATRIYPALRDDLLAADARFLLLIGDQLYADAVPPISVRDELPGDADHPPPLDLLVNAYRKVTRGFFAERGFRSLREALPTLCMWDDHDIFNNWGSLKTETALDKQLLTAAARVFAEYQDARNPEGDRVPPFDCFYRFGTAGFLLLDVRGVRSYEQGTFFGRVQWERILSFLRSNTATEIQTLFVVSSVPIAHASRWLAALLEWIPGDYGDAVRDRWVSSVFRASRDAFLDALFAWQDAGSHRQVCILSG